MHPIKRNHIIFLLTFATLAILLSGCAGGGATTASSWPGLTIDGDTAYLAYNNYVYAVQLTNGSMKWRYPSEANRSVSFYADPVLSPDGQLIVGSYNHVLYSLNPQNGTMRWEFDQAINRYIASPLVIEQGIFAPNSDDKLYALDLNGNLRWTSEAAGESWARPVTGQECDCIYVSSLDHSLFKLDPADGSVIWQSETLGGSIVGVPALNETGSLYIGTFNSEVLALNSQNGEVLWRVPTKDWVWSGPILADDRLYVGDLAGNFYALNAENGETIWQLTPEQLDGPIVGSPLVTDDSIYFGSETGTLFALDKSGNTRWTQTSGGKLYTSPKQAGDLILGALILIAYPLRGSYLEEVKEKILSLHAQKHGFQTSSLC